MKHMTRISLVTADWAIVRVCNLRNSRLVTAAPLVDRDVTYPQHPPRVVLIVLETLDADVAPVVL